MFEKVNPDHPDKVADRIAGAIVDLAYAEVENPKIAVEVLIGHGHCHIIVESDTWVEQYKITEAVYRITGDKSISVDSQWNSQDVFLSNNQKNGFRCGDNGIFKGSPVSKEQKDLSRLAHKLHEAFTYDGKYILSNDDLIICQSNAREQDIRNFLKDEYYRSITVNPLGEWTGGTDVDTGATNRKLGSDMADSVTGGGLHGKDLSKADVSVNIYAFLKAQETGETVNLCCAIGDDMIDGKPYGEIVEIAREYIKNKGGFEKFAEWGLV